MKQRIRKKYLNDVVPKLKEKFIYQNINQIPLIKKVIINRGLGQLQQNNKSIENFSEELAIITGQQGVITHSKKAIASFKLRKKSPIGVSVTLRGARMYAFLDRLINLALPRIRDFQGLNRSSFDQNGNYTIGVSEQLMFPEIEFENGLKYRL